jgi:hypothetical protein
MAHLLTMYMYTYNSTVVHINVFVCVCVCVCTRLVFYKITIWLHAWIIAKSYNYFNFKAKVRPSVIHFIPWCYIVKTWNHYAYIKNKTNLYVVSPYSTCRFPWSSHETDRIWDTYNSHNSANHITKNRFGLV